VGTVEALVEDEATETTVVEDGGTEKVADAGGMLAGNNGLPTEDGIYTAGGRMGSGGGGIIDGPTPGGYISGIGG
jgi:hypothetical protein